MLLYEYHCHGEILFTSYIVYMLVFSFCFFFDKYDWWLLLEDVQSMFLLYVCIYAVFVVLVTALSYLHLIRLLSQ